MFRCFLDLKLLLKLAVIIFGIHQGLLFGLQNYNLAGHSSSCLSCWKLEKVTRESFEPRSSMPAWAIQ